MAFGDLIRRRPPPWETPEGALGFIDPQFPDLLGLDLVVDLLRVAAGEEVTAERRISDEQFDLISRHRCVPLIPEHWTCPENRREDTLRKLTFLAMTLEATAKDVIALLRTDGIEPVVLKGMATSRLDYPRPELRHSGDIDLLIAPDMISTAVSSLEQAGYSRKDPDQFDDEFLKGETLVSPSGIEVDIHTRLTLVGGALEPHDLGLGRLVEELGAKALSDELRLVHAASHFFFGPPQHRRLSGFADIAAIRSRTELDLMSVRHAAQATALEAPTFAGLAAEARLTGRSVDQLVSWNRPTGWLCAGYARPKRSRFYEQMFVAFSQPSTRATVRYLKQKAIPTEAVRSHRGGFFEYARGRTR